MVSKPLSRVCGGLKAALLVVMALCLAPSILAQHGSEGTVTVTVLDPSGSVVQGAQLELRDLATNDVRKGETQDKGTYTFVNLPLGVYKLTVSKSGFRNRGGERRGRALSRNDDQCDRNNH